MKPKYLLAGLLASLIAGLMLSVAQAQVPPHRPGTVCYTPAFWCWAPQPGSPGQPCACPTPEGWVPGRLG